MIITCGCSVVQQLSGTGEFRLELQTIRQQQSVFIIREKAHTKCLLLVESAYWCFHI